VWNVVLVAEVHEWFLALNTETAEAVAQAVNLLEHDGPGLGRPTVDSIKGSSVHNLKELREERYRKWLSGEYSEEVE
jgi:hypothetical protein